MWLGWPFNYSFTLSETILYAMLLTISIPLAILRNQHIILLSKRSIHLLLFSKMSNKAKPKAWGSSKPASVTSASVGGVNQAPQVPPVTTSKASPAGQAISSPTAKNTIQNYLQSLSDSSRGNHREAFLQILQTLVVSLLTMRNLNDYKVLAYL